MKKSSSILIIWIISFYFLNKTFQDGMSQILFASGIIIALLGYLSPNIKILSLVYLGFFAFAIKFPNLTYYTPMLFYLSFSLTDIKNPLCYLPIILSLFYRPEIFIDLLILYSLSYILALKDRNFEKIDQEYKDYYNKSSKLQVSLEKLNKDLIINQNENLSNALLSERNRIAGDIHDGVGHLISRSILQLGALSITEKDPERKEDLVLITDNLKTAMADIRKSVHSIIENDLDLEKEIRKLLDGQKDIKTNFTYNLSYPFTINEKYSLLFVIKEALNNTRKHSNASEFALSIRESTEMVFILIKDNGSNIKLSDSGMGLYSMENRIEKISGSFNYTTNDGFRIFITIKKEKNRNESSSN